MKIRSVHLLVAALASVGLVVACQSSDSASPGGGGAGSGQGGNGGSGGGAGGSGGAAGNVDDSGTAGTGGAAGADAAPTCVDGTATTITNVANGTVPTGTQVNLTGVVAMTSKFLVSKSSKGTCLWGVYVSEPIAQAVEYSGTMIVSTGDTAVTVDGGKTSCPTGTDAIPDDVTAGDELSLTGKADSFALSSCPGVAADAGLSAPAKQVQISNTCKMTRTGTGKALPAPAIVANADDLSNSALQATHDKWGGVLVTIQNVTATDGFDGGPVDGYGTIVLTNGIQVQDDLYYKKDGKPSYPAGTTFTSLTGLSALDYCFWSLKPLDKCTSYVPASADCTDGGTPDASAD